MIRNPRPGRKVYAVSYNDERSPFPARTHVVEFTVLGLAHAMGDGRRPVLVGYKPRYAYQTGTTEVVAEHLWPTPESAAAAFRRKWGRDCEPLPAAS